MTSIVLVPWGSTDWGEAGRLSARTPLTLNAHGARQAAKWANELAGRELSAVYCAAEATSRQVAEVLSRRAEVKLKTLDGLEEVDVGLWEGLTPKQIEVRYPKVFKMWMDNPSVVCPPDGELLGDAADRLIAAVHRVTKKTRGATAAIVLGPLALAAIRSKLEHGHADHLHSMKSSDPVWYRVADGKPELIGAPAA